MITLSLSKDELAEGCILSLSKDDPLVLCVTQNISISPSVVLIDVINIASKEADRICRKVYRVGY